MAAESTSRSPGTPDERTPRYRQPTITHSAPEFANHEQDIIRQSFTVGNCTYLRESVPVDLGPDSVSLLRRRRANHNRLAESLPRTWSRMAPATGGDFMWMADEYDRKQVADRQNRLLSLEQQKQISPSDWRGPSQAARLKHEPLHDRDECPSYLSQCDNTADIVHLRPWLRRGYDSEVHTLDLTAASSFLAGKGSGLNDGSRSSRMTLQTIVHRLQRRMELDWEGTTVVVTATEQDMVQVAFHAGTVDSELGVRAYMDVLAKDPDFLAPLGLKKASQLWGVLRDFPLTSRGWRSAGGSTSARTSPSDRARETWIVFLFTPKWVTMRPTDAYYTSNPRLEGSAFRMSPAGTSVMFALDDAADEERSAASSGSSADAPGVAAASTRQRARKSLEASPRTGRARRPELWLILEAVNKLPPALPAP